MFKKSYKQKGVSAIITIVILSVAGLIMAYSAVILGLGELEMGYNLQQGGETLAIADGCMEEALRRIRVDSSYSGDTLNLGDGSCIISVAGSDSSRTITVISSIGNYNKKIESNISLSGSGKITIDSWEELSS